MKTTGNTGHGGGNSMVAARARTSAAAAVCAVIGGTLWALTPLRQPIFNAGGHPSEGELFFRGYNAVGIIIVLLLTFALFQLGRQAPSPASWTFRIGWWIVLAGNAAMIAGSLPAIVLGGQAETVVKAGQDAGFLGAMLAALGAILLGIAGLRQRPMPKPVAALFIAALPVGLLVSTLLGIIGVPEVYLGLPLTVLYGSAWTWLGVSWARQSQPQPQAPPASGLHGSTA